MKDYQTNAASAAMTELGMPTTVSIAMSELTGAVREGLLALAVGAGLQVMQVMMEQNVTAACGPKGRRIVAAAQHSDTPRAASTAALRSVGAASQHHRGRREVVHQAARTGLGC